MLNKVKLKNYHEMLPRHYLQNYDLTGSNVQVRNGVLPLESIDKIYIICKILVILNLYYIWEHSR